MVSKIYYAYGEHCCLHICSDDQKKTITQAVKEGYGFIVEYFESSEWMFPRRVIQAWSAEVLPFESVVNLVKDNLYLKVLNEKGCNTFVKAPLPDGSIEVFPLDDFDAFIKISL